jgi:hypothetical protein
MTGFVTVRVSPESATCPSTSNIATVTDSDATLTGQPSGKTLKIYIIAANDAGQAAPSDTVTIVVP